MTFRTKHWTSLSAGLALIGASTLSACGGEAPDGEEDTPLAVVSSSGPEKNEAGEMGEAGESGEAGEIGHGGETLPLPKRLAFMSGHVEAGLALYRAGKPGMAAPHLLHPVSETHSDEREGLDALGFDGNLFEAVSTALNAGQAATEIEPQLAAAEANLASVAERAGGNPIEIVEFLMQIVVEEYTIGVTEKAITDPGEYQDAYGFAIVALDRAQGFQGEAGDRVRAELQELIDLWPEPAPVPTDTPAPVAAINAQVGNVLLELSGVR